MCMNARLLSALTLFPLAVTENTAAITERQPCPRASTSAHPHDAVPSADTENWACAGPQHKILYVCAFSPALRSTGCFKSPGSLHAAHSRQTRLAGGAPQPGGCPHSAVLLPLLSNPQL